MYLFGCGCGKKRDNVRTRPQVTKPVQTPTPPPTNPPKTNQSNGYQGQGS
jgi:hypothetical protein